MIPACRFHLLVANEHFVLYNSQCDSATFPHLECFMYFILFFVANFLARPCLSLYVLWGRTPRPLLSSYSQHMEDTWVPPHKLHDASGAPWQSAEKPDSAPPHITKCQAVTPRGKAGSSYPGSSNSTSRFWWHAHWYCISVPGGRVKYFARVADQIVPSSYGSGSNTIYVFSF